MGDAEAEAGADAETIELEAEAAADEEAVEAVAEGEAEGAAEGEAEGAAEEAEEGAAEGEAEGAAEGAEEGAAEGEAEGAAEGEAEGAAEEAEEGAAEGEAEAEGAAEGEEEGEEGLEVEDQGADGNGIPSLLSSPYLTSSNEALNPDNANMASDAENAIPIYDISGNLVAYQYVDGTGATVMQPVDRYEGSEYFWFPDDPYTVPQPAPNPTGPTPTQQLSPDALQQLNNAIQEAVGASDPSSFNTEPPQSINEVLSGTDWMSPDNTLPGPAVQSIPANPTVPFDPTAASPFTKWLLYGSDTPTLDFLTSDSKLRAAQNAALDVSLGAATIATGGLLLEAVPAALAAANAAAASAATTFNAAAAGFAPTLLTVGAGAGGYLAESSGLTEEVEEEVESLGPQLQDTLGPELKSSLQRLTGNWTMEEFDELLREYGYQRHHVFPQELEDDFEQIGIEDIHEYTYPLESKVHAWLHSPQGGNWNALWESWLDEVALPNGLGPEDAAEFAKSLFVRFNIPFDPRNLLPY